MATDARVYLHGEDQLPNPPAFDYRTYPDTSATLTLDHARASYGQPVLVWHGQAYGPGDIALDRDTGSHISATWDADHDLLAQAEAAGWRIQRRFRPYANLGRLPVVPAY